MKSYTTRATVRDEETGQEYDIRYRVTKYKETSEHFGQMRTDEVTEVDIIDDGGCLDTDWLHEYVCDMVRGW